MSTVFIVFAKEVRENLRDRRTLLSALVYGPLIGPVMIVLLLGMMISNHQHNAHAPLKIPVAGIAHAPTLVTELKQAGLVPEPLTASPQRMVESRQAKVVIRIPADYAKQWEQGKPAQVELFYDSSQRGVDTTVSRVKALLSTWSRKQGLLRLVARGISPTVVAPLVVASRDLSTPQSRAGRFLAFVPYFFIVALFTGGMYLANDLTAGERERKSLEPLFANPVARWRILVGKLCTVSAFAFASLVICLVAIVVVVRFLPVGSLDITLNLGIRFAAVSLLLLVPLVTLVSVAQTLLAAFAKSYREAQSYLQIMMIVLIIPSMLMSFMPMKPQPWMYLVPVMGQQLGITQLMRGEAPDVLQVVLCLVGSAVATLALGAVTLRVYHSERLAISA